MLNHTNSSLNCTFKNKRYSLYYKYLPQTKMPVWVDICMSSFHTVELNTTMQASQYSPYAMPERAITLICDFFHILCMCIYMYQYFSTKSNKYTRLLGKSIRFSKCISLCSISLCSGYHIYNRLIILL